MHQDVETIGAIGRNIFGHRSALARVARYAGLGLIVASCGTVDAASGTSGESAVAAVALPGRIQAEGYRAGGEGVGYHDTTSGNQGGAYRTDAVDIQATTDTGGGYNVGWIAAGEWLAYDVQVGQAGSYDLTLRVASGKAGTKGLHVEVDGRNVTGMVTFTDASGWQSWKSVAARGVVLTVGAHVVKLVADSGDFNVNYVDAAYVAPPPGLLDNFRAIGFSSSRSGLGGSNTEFLNRLNQMSAASGIPVADLRRNVWSHQYNPGIKWDAAQLGSFQWVAEQHLAGIVQNQRPGNLQTWASGGFDANIRAYLTSVSAWARANGTKAILILHHEPENDTTPQESAWWSMGQARFIKLTHDHDDPNVIACVNLMFYPGSQPASNFDFTDEVLGLCNGNATCRQSVLDRTLLGFDPYPEVRNGVLGTVRNKIGDDVTWWRARGLKHFFLPEVGLYHWNSNVTSQSNPDGIFPLTDRQQAQRFYDNFTGDLLQGTIHGFMYFDVSDWTNTNYRGGTRELGQGNIGADGTVYPNPDAAARAAPLELTEFARTIMDIDHARP